MVKDSDPSKWNGDPHTGARHDILGSYLDGWFPKLGWNKRILFFDGFAGRGFYNDGSDGSPIVALRKISSHSVASTRPDTLFDFLFVERDPENAAALQLQIDELERALPSGFPANVHYEVKIGTFDDNARALLDKDNHVPVFAFIDPFGFKNMPFETIRRFVDLPRTEVFINLMVDWMARFGEKVDPESMASAFGLPADEVLKDYDSQMEIERHQHLRDLYMGQLRDVAHFKYTLSFAMHGDNGHVLYYLIYGTNSEAGVELMKRCLWNADPVSGSGFRDRVARDTNMLWPPEEDGPDLVPLEDVLLETYSGQSDVPFSDIRREVLLGSAQYRDTQAAEVLIELDRRRSISISKTGKSQKTWTVTFPPRSRDAN